VNILSKIFSPKAKSEMTLGNPLSDLDGARSRRLMFFAAKTGGKGFREFPKEPRRDAQGMTRGERKRERRAVADRITREQIAASRAKFEAKEFDNADR
jgi:hypothetical protein